MIDKFPKIEGIVWLSKQVPDLVCVKITLEDKKKESLGIPGLDIEDIEVDQYFDLSKLCGIRDWYPTNMDSPAEDECLVDVDGIPSFALNISKEKLLEAWLFYKEFTK